MKKSLLLMVLTVVLMGTMGCSKKESETGNVVDKEPVQEKEISNVADEEQIKEKVDYSKFPITNSVIASGDIKFYNDLGTKEIYNFSSDDNPVQQLEFKIVEMKDEEYDLEKIKLVIKDTKMEFPSDIRDDEKINIELEFDKIPSMYVIGYEEYMWDNKTIFLLITEDTEYYSDYHILRIDEYDYYDLRAEYLGVIENSIFRGDIEPSNSYGVFENKYTFSAQKWFLAEDISGVTSYTFNNGIEVAESTCKRFENTYTLRCDMNILAEKEIEADKVTIKKGTKVKVIVEPGDGFAEISSGDVKGYYKLCESWSGIDLAEGFEEFEEIKSEMGLAGD